MVIFAQKLFVSVALVNCFSSQGIISLHKSKDVDPLAVSPFLDLYRHFVLTNVFHNLKSEEQDQQEDC